MIGELDGQVTWFDLDSWYGKTCQERFQAETRKGQTSRPLSKKSSKSANLTPMCISVSRINGQKPDAITLRMADGLLLGDYTTRSFGESPNVAVESRLSQILEDCALPKYYLSATACEGILRRAAKRGKELPTALRQALENQVNYDRNGGDSQN